MFSGLVCMRKLTVRTNWPTVAEKPERKALKGCVEVWLLADVRYLPYRCAVKYFKQIVLDQLADNHCLQTFPLSLYSSDQQDNKS